MPETGAVLALILRRVLTIASSNSDAEVPYRRPCYAQPGRHFSSKSVVVKDFDRFAPPEVV